MRLKFLNKNTLFYLLLFSFFSNFAYAKSQILRVGYDNRNNIEIVIDKKTEFKVYTLNNPNRLVVDIKLADYNNISLEERPNFIKNIRYAKKKSKNVRIVFDLNRKTYINSAKYSKKKGNKYGKITIKTSAKTSYALANFSKSKGYTVNNTRQKREIPIVVIDAGHGGKDPGAIGRYLRTKEKNITLSYAKELARQLKSKKRYKIYLTRGDDRYITLKGRVSKARKVKADLFISIHANSAEDHHAKGFSIYTLSEKASDKEAEKIAQKENRADIISGINFVNASQDILKTLIDLSQRSSMNQSSKFANIAIKSVKENKIDILQNTHRFAGFVVLTAPDMVSILIELGYLSNKSEEKDLNNLYYKRRIVKGLVEAIDEYFIFKRK